MGKWFKNNLVFIILVVLVTVLFPTTISLPQQSRSENIVTAMGIDKSEGELEVSIQYIVPYATGGQETLKVSSAKGITVGEAVENINAQHGKITGFAHCRTVVLNDEACSENITELLDYLLRTKTNTNNIILMNTEKSAKELLNAVKDLDNEFYTILSSNNFAAEQRHFHELKSIGDYYGSLFGPYHCTYFTTIDVEDDTNSGATNSSNGGEQNDKTGGSGSGGGGSGSQSKKMVSNKGKISIIKNSKKIATLSPDEADDLNWFLSSVEDQKLEALNLNDEVYTNASGLFDVYNKEVYKKTYFVNGVPHLDLTLDLSIRTSQITSSDLSKKYYVVENKRLSREIKTQIESSVKEKLVRAESRFKENNYDVIGCFDHFYQYNNKELKNYLTSHEKDDFIKDVVFNYTVKVTQRM